MQHSFITLLTVNRERILTCICDWLIEKLFGSFWGAIALVLFGLLTWPLASSIRSLPLYSPWVADRLWQIVVLFWPQQLLNFFIAWPLVGYAAIVGLVFYSILCVVVRLCHRLFAWDTLSNGFVEIGIVSKFRISYQIEKVDGHGAKLNDNRYRLVDSSNDLEVKIAKHPDRMEPNAATVDYQSLYEELRKQHEQDQRAVGQVAVPKDVGPRHNNIDDLSISTKSHTSRHEKDLSITHGNFTSVSDIKQSIHTHEISEGVESGRELADFQRTFKAATARLDDREAELRAERETSATWATAFSNLTESNTIADIPSEEVERRNEQLPCNGKISPPFHHLKPQASGVCKRPRTVGSSKTHRKLKPDWNHLCCNIRHMDLQEAHDTCKLQTSHALAQAEVDRANLTSRAEGAERTVATLSGQLKELHHSRNVSSERVGELEQELGTARGELESHAAEAAKAKNKALASFSKTFPGGFDIIPTASTDAQCGFYAVIESIKAMNLSRTTRPLPVPSCADLLAAYKSHDVQQFYLESYAAIELSNEDTAIELGRTGFFSVEQVFQALDHWASTKDRGLKFQIGYLKQHGPQEQAYQPPQLVGCKHDDDPDCIVVWLHHNGAGEDSRLAHYSGMRNHTPRP